MIDPPYRILSVDPGTSTGAVVVCTRLSDSLSLTESTEVSPNRGQSSVSAFMAPVASAAERLEAAPWRRAVVEFPSGVHMGRGNTATMLKVSRVAAEVATRIQREFDIDARFFDANDLRKRGVGHVIPNDERPRLFERVFGNDPDDYSDHEIDAALFVAKTEGIL
ncbi:hypothetical protein [Salinibacter phage M31CR41-2]|uniref:Uncharacterized protein n=1 Tax=Salinibacter phage M31CR41-2 TaxID=2681614 RepID=A0A2I6UH51_9CAUD|nr:hypothetical protein FGG68_gp24 [Salinibacter phage M31CR41-2]AUO79291.1 hypothetical protein [Salinibacter phage M31CR41-2]